MRSINDSVGTDKSLPTCICLAVTVLSTSLVIVSSTWNGFRYMRRARGSNNASTAIPAVLECCRLLFGVEAIGNGVECLSTFLLHVLGDVARSSVCPISGTAFWHSVTYWRLDEGGVLGLQLRRWYQNTGYELPHSLNLLRLVRKVCWKSGIVISAGNKGVHCWFRC